jgi:hypothetical protein
LRGGDYGVPSSAVLAPGAQFRTMKKYRYFNNLGSRRKFTRQAKNASPGLKISFKGRKF